MRSALIKMVDGAEQLFGGSTASESVPRPEAVQRPDHSANWEAQIESVQRNA